MLSDLRTLPRIVGGIDKRSSEAAAGVFGVLHAPIYIFEDPKITETAKLFEMVYRDVNIALANEFSMISEKLGIDVWKAIEAANTNPKTHILTPGPNVGGTCLPKDPYFLVCPSIRAGFEPRLIILARQINDAMPQYAMEIVERAFREIRKPIKNSRIAILGIAFKSNARSLENSSAIFMIKELVRYGACLVVQDPLVDLNEAQKLFPALEMTRDIDKAVTNATCIIIHTAHRQYFALNDIQLVNDVSEPLILIDLVGILNKRNFKAANLFYYTL